MKQLPLALIGVGLALVLTQEIVIAILGAGVTILTTLAVILSNARTRRQEALEVYTTALVEDCNSLRNRISSLESELRIAQDTLIEWQEKYLHCLHELHQIQGDPTQVDPPLSPDNSTDPVPTLDLDP